MDVLFVFQNTLRWFCVIYRHWNSLNHHVYQQIIVFRKIYKQNWSLDNVKAYESIETGMRSRLYFFQLKIYNIVS